MTEYEPRGRVLKLLAVTDADPMREITSSEARGILGCGRAAVVPTVEYAIKHGRLHRRREGRSWVYRGTPYEGARVAEPPIPRRRNAAKQQRDPNNLKAAPPPPWTPDPEDPRIPRVDPGWKPPRMVCTRGGA